MIKTYRMLIPSQYQYLIIGIKPCLDGKSNNTTGKEDKSGTGFSMPLAAAFELPLNLSAGVSVSISDAGRTLEKAKTPGEYIFAVQYKKVTKSSGLSASQPIKPTKDAMNFEWGYATSNDAQQKDDSFEVDDDELFEPAVEPDEGGADEGSE